MNNKESFEIFLTDKYKSKKTTKNYISGINTASKEITNLLNDNVNIYNISNKDVIHEFREMFLHNEHLRAKNSRGKRMYTAALSAYIKFLSSFYSNQDTIHITHEIIYKPKSKGEFRIEEGKKQWKRNSTIVNNVLVSNNYMCEYDPSHISFISHKTNNNYVEGHHLIPMSYQDNFEHSLDTEANVISLCPVCHRLLHFGIFEDKINILEKLYKSRYDKLSLTGINITFNDLLLLYK